MGRDSFDHSRSPVRNHRSSHRSPFRRERSPAHHRSSYSTKSPPREKPSNRTKSPKRPKSPISHSPPRDKPLSYTKSSKYTRSRSPSDRLHVKEPALRSPGSRSPSPRSKRLRRDRSNHKDDKSSERVSEKNHRKTRSPEYRSSSPRTRRLRRAHADVGDKISDKGMRKQKDLERERRDRTSGRDADDSGSYKSRQVEHHRTRHISRSPTRDEGNNLREDRGGIVRRSNETMRIIVTMFIDIVFGFFLGVSFPTISLTKINLPSTLLPSIDLGYIEDKYLGLSSQALLNVCSSLGNKGISLHEPEDAKIWLPTNPQGAETLPPDIVTSESDLHLRRLYSKPSEEGGGARNCWASGYHQLSQQIKIDLVCTGLIPVDMLHLKNNGYRY